MDITYSTKPLPPRTLPPTQQEEDLEQAAATQRTTAQRRHSCLERDADELSTTSRGSYMQPMHAASDCESNCATVSVRDMIKRYNSAATVDSTGSKTPVTSIGARRPSQFMLPATKSSFCGINKFVSKTNVKRSEADCSEDDAIAVGKSAFVGAACPRSSSGSSSCKVFEAPLPPRPTSIVTLAADVESCRRNAQRSNGGECDESQLLKHKNSSCSNKSCSKKRSNHRSSSNPRSSSNGELSDGGSVGKETPITINSARNINSSSKELNGNGNGCQRRPSNESLDELNFQPVEASYQSKTTIVKTASGVRIIIDIFFEQDQTVATSDVIGSRVETDIPQSRILTEFQQQTLQAQASQH